MAGARRYGKELSAVSCQRSAVSSVKGGSSMKMSRLEAAIRVSLEFYEAFNRHDAAGMMKLVSEDCLFEGSGPAPEGATYSGKEAVTEFWQEFFRASPQAQI